MDIFQDDHFYQKLAQSYDDTHDHSGVSGDRLARRLTAISYVGVTEEGGVNRPGFSKEEQQAKDLVIDWMTEAGLEVSVDGAGNVFGRLEGQVDLPPIVSGSHIDSVPNGGNFDGVLGVLSALEVVEAWKEQDYVPRKPFEIAIFTDEEGARFKSGLTGSRAFMGQISKSELDELEDSEGRGFPEVIEAYGSTVDEFLDYEFKRKAIDMFIELHIEQGKLLEKENEPVGIVNGIAGPAWMEVTFKGEAGHAGNTPMIGRKDANVAAGSFIKRVADLPGKVSDTAVATVGQINVKPNGVNVIPEETNVTVDIRDIHEETRDELVNRIKKEAKSIAASQRVRVDITYNSTIKPLPIKEEFQLDLVDILTRYNIKPVHIPSGAGHDAMILGNEIPTAMIFVRSKNGVSHHPSEWSTLTDCVQGIHILKDLIEKKMEES